MKLIYRDQVLAAFHKPAGLLVHRSAIDRRETRFALQEARDQLGRRVYPVHRLDKPTSGVLLFALDTEVARHLTQAFTDGRVRKVYRAVVRGYGPPEAVIDYPLRELVDPMTDRLADPHKPARAAVTRCRRLATVELPFPVGRYPSARYSLLEVRPLTGRRHQIRRHLKHVFHPVVGDTTHGDGRHNAFFRRHFHCHRLLLAATELVLPHPLSGGELRLTAEPEFAGVVAAIPWIFDAAGDSPGRVTAGPALG